MKSRRGQFKEAIALLRPMAFLCFTALVVLGLTQAAAQAFTLNVVGSDGNAVSAYRWMVVEDTTNITVPGAPVNNSISMSIHNSYAPVLDKGHSTTQSATIGLPGDKPYFVTVLPDGLPPNGVPRYAMSGTTVPVGQNFITVTVNEMPIPTAQIYLIAFVDHNPISNARDERETGLGGCTVLLHDFSGGQVSVDAFGNPLDTTYQTDIFGDPFLDADGSPVIDQLGDGIVTTLSQADIDAGNNPHNLKLGEALVKNLPPGKYGVIINPPTVDDAGNPVKWSQTSTIEGTPTIDAWVKAKEPKLFVEGFGTGRQHAQYGFVKVSPLTPSVIKGQTVTALQGNVVNGLGTPTGTGTISGTVRMNHFDRPPNVQGLNPGVIVDECWVGLNDALLIAEVELVPFVEQPVEVIDALKPSAGLYAVPCNADGTFVIENVPPGDYQIVTWDTPLDTLFGFHTVTVPAGASGTGDPVNVGDLLTFRWFGTLEGTIFNDDGAGNPALAENGIQDPGEIGIVGQAVNLRFRDGSIYQTQPTDLSGNYEFAEVFPFFKWLVAEVDFARFKATGSTVAVDYGGPIADLFSPVWPTNGNKNPQPQDPADPFNVYGTIDYRTETGPVLTHAMHLFLNQTNLIDWGKVAYGANENGGISGVIFYDTTRAEDDPRYNAGEPWQPGIPRVQVNLYQDNLNNVTGLPSPDGIVDDLDGSGGPTYADVDNYPFGNFPGPEDIDRNYPGQTSGAFDYGDAIEIATSDSWDDNKPSGCIQNLPVVHGLPIPECADAFGTWNQVRPGIFDGGYAFGPEIDCPAGVCPNHVNQSATDPSIGYLKSGNYIVEAVPPPHYEIGRSQDKNVDFGEIYIPSPLLLPPVCVGDPYVVPAELTLFPGVPANLAGQTLTTCDRKQTTVIEGKNTAADFFMFTEVPAPAMVVGFANNDLGAEFNQASPIFGEKLGAPWIPVSFRDWTGKELFRVYADEFGHYNALLPSTYSINVPSPSGVAPNMITMVLNDPILPDGTLDPWYNQDYSVTPWTFNYQPGTVTYTDTPLVPVAAFTTAEVGLDTNQVDGGPVISQVYATAAGPGTGPMVCSANLPGSVTLTSTGLTEILNPAWDPTAATTVPRTIFRDYGFGATQGSGTVTLDGAALAVSGWANDQITVTIPAGSTTGRVTVQRGDTGIAAELGVTLHVIDCATETVMRVPSQFPTIQAAIDAAPYAPDTIGPLVLVAPGTYTENVIINKPVRLQGAGTGSTFINGNPTPIERLDAWHNRIEPPVAQGGLNGLALENYMLKYPFTENEAPTIIVFGEQFFPDGAIGAWLTDPPLPLANVFNPGYRFGTADDYVNPDGTPKVPFLGVGAPVAGVAIPGQSLIDGFTLSGSKAGGGIYIFTRARGLQVSNNNVTNNQGNYAGGISVGVPDAGFQMFDEDDFRFRTAGFQNTDVAIIYNKVHKNGGFQGAGGIALSEDSHGYLVKDNLIIGNFSRFHGGGIAHIGRSDFGTIQHNRILFNENFFGAILLRAGDGGGIYMGGDLAGGTGAGFDLSIDGNLIQGNMTGSGRGGGMRITAFNGLDVLSINDPDLICDIEFPEACPNPWPLFKVSITNNIVVNNVAGLDGGGISLQDVSKAVIANNTIANNDSTMVGRSAFPAGSLSSIPAPAGVSSHPHSAILAHLWGLAHGQPGLAQPPTPGIKILEFCIQGHPFEDPGNPNPPECAGVQEPDYANPTLANNIVWHNNSWFFDGTATDPATGGLVGALAANPAGPYWDLGVEGGTAAQVLSPQNSILSALTGPDGTVYNGTNLALDPLFVSEYANTLQATTVIDEGGNNVNIRFLPLEVGTSDYHITAGSPAVGAADNAIVSSMAKLAMDIDRENRPLGNGPDIGADELLQNSCQGDFNNDGVVNTGDFIILRSQLGADCGAVVCSADLNGDGNVTMADFIIFRAGFGRTDCFN